MSDRYVIAKFTNSGFGDHLSCLFGAWWYAERTGRVLVVDWRGSRFNAAPGQNCVTQIFRIGTVLAGVPVIADDRVAEIDPPAPYYPAKWTAPALAGIAHVPHTAEEIRAVNALVVQGTDRPEPTVVFNQHISPDPPVEVRRRLLADLSFAPAIVEAADRFLAEHAAGKPLIGVHIRHGNGENIGGRAAFWLDPLSLVRQLRRNKRHDIHRAGAPAGAFFDNTAPSLTARPGVSGVERALYRRIGDAVRGLRGAGLPEAAVLLCTDAARVETGLKGAVDGVVSYAKHMLSAGAGPLHQIGAVSNTDGAPPVRAEIITDMLVEMELLRRCQALICMPSQFSVLSRSELPADRILTLKPPLVNRAIGRLIG